MDLERFLFELPIEKPDQGPFELVGNKHGHRRCHSEPKPGGKLPWRTLELETNLKNDVAVSFQTSLENLTVNISVLPPKLPAPLLIHRLRDQLGRIKDQTTQGIHQAKIYFCGKYHAYAPSGKRVAIGTLILLLVLNFACATAKANGPSALTRYRHHCWMYTTSPAQAIGLPQPIAPRVLPSKVDIAKAWHQFKIKLSPDKMVLNGFRTDEEAHQVYMRGFNAHEALQKMYLNPYNPRTKEPFEKMLDPSAVSGLNNDTLPHFAPQCNCTFAKVLLADVKKAVIPFNLQHRPPQTSEDLKSFCPCTWALAAASYNSFPRDAPPLFRIRNSVPWATLHPRVWLWKFRADFFRVVEIINIPGEGQDPTASLSNESRMLLPRSCKRVCIERVRGEEVMQVGKKRDCKHALTTVCKYDYIWWMDLGWATRIDFEARQFWEADDQPVQNTPHPFDGPSGVRWPTSMPDLYAHEWDHKIT